MLGLLTFNNRENPIPFLVRPNNKGRPVLPRPFLSCHSVILSIVFVCSKRPGLLQQPDFPLNFLIRGFFFVAQSLYQLLVLPEYLFTFTVAAKPRSPPAFWTYTWTRNIFFLLLLQLYPQWVRCLHE